MSTNTNPLQQYRDDHVVFYPDAFDVHHASSYTGPRPYDQGDNGGQAVSRHTDLC
jgi:hypothetical protein